MSPDNYYGNQVVAPPPVAGGPLQPLPKEKKPILLFVILGVLVIAIIGLGIFGYWAYAQMKDYKNNHDAKVAVAVQQAEEEQKKTLDAQFAEQEKSPLKSYTSPAQFGSVKIVYPKTWSAYINEQLLSGGTAVDGYFYPDFVPSINSEKVTYSLRVQIVDGAYKNATNPYQANIKLGKLTAKPFIAETVEGASEGIRLDGQLTANKKGAMVIVPLRDKILKIWTESESGVADFDNIVIKNLTFSP